MVNTKINSFFIVISGFFKFDFSKPIDKSLFLTYDWWNSRINEGDYKSTFNYLQGSYYDSYLNIMLPEVRKEVLNHQQLCSKFLNHLTYRKQHLEPYQSIKIAVSNSETINFNIGFIDVFLFPQESGIFSIKFEIQNPEDLSLTKISSFINKIRQLNSIFEISPSQSMDLKSFINTYVLKNLMISNDWNVYNPQLKSYIMLDLAESIDNTGLDNLLYDIGNNSPIGSASGNGFFAPSENYYTEQMNNNKISVFKNWSCLSLFDTFTRISINAPDKMKSWEYDYFNLYIHALFVKFFLYNINTAISDVTKVSKNTEKLRDLFIEFMNDFYHTHVSYKFLPNLMVEKLYNSLLINAEIDKLETKILRLNNYFSEKRQQKMNLVLITLTFLGVISLVSDLSSWLINLGIEKKYMFPVGSPIILAILVLSLYIIFKSHKKSVK